MSKVEVIFWTRRASATQCAGEQRTHILSTTEFEYFAKYRQKKVRRNSKELCKFFNLKDTHALGEIGLMDDHEICTCSVRDSDYLVMLRGTHIWPT